MESVIIATPPGYESKLRSRLLACGFVQTGPEIQFVLDSAGSRVYFASDEHVIDEIEPDQLELVLSIVDDPIFYALDFSDIALCRRALYTIADDPDLVVDNDHGVILRGSEFVRLLWSRPHWDWRLDAV